MSAAQASGSDLTPQRERSLIERAQRGCGESVHALIAAHQGRLHSFVWRMVRDRHEAEEICQEAFLRAFSSLHSFDFAYRFSTWLFTIGYRLCLNSIRRRGRQAADFEMSSLPARGGDGSGSENVAEAVANSSEARRLKEMIWDSVDQLTPAQRAAVLLFYRESLSCERIGEILGMPAATVKSHLHRARRRLKEMLQSRLSPDWFGVRFGELGTGA